jgi:uncharacterized membrane protein YphA (DoxX/SURF4 family)
MLVLLRITIGWHFLYQGLWKLDNPDFSSAGFLSNAKGPLADRYYDLVPDFWGRERLNEERALAAIDQWRREFGRRFELNADQTRLADRIVEMRKAQVREFFQQNKEAIETYFHDLKRHEETKQSAASQLDFQKQRNWKQHQDLQRKAQDWLAQLERLTQQYHEDLAGLLHQEPGKVAALLDPDAFTMDDFITLSNIAIGACLIVGLFTRLASLGGAMFLLTIVLAQPEWPGIYPPAPAAAGRSLLVTKEFVEMVALLALAALPTGRWAGLDFFLHYLIVQPLFGKRVQGPLR